MRIFLADLGHNQLTLSSDVYPLGVANLATYTQGYFNGPDALEIAIFREPEDLKAALDAAPPDVLALSSYSWNHYLSLTYARYAKRRSAKVLTVMGGPNFPLTTGEQETFLRSMPEIDVASRGPTYEGERAFLNLIQRFSAAGLSLEGLQEEPVTGNAWIHWRTGQFTQGGEPERIVDLDEIRSPYLAGFMEPFFATGYFPMLQIARGCPFSCTFCNSSVQSNSKIYAHSANNVKEDLLYIAKRVRKEIPLCFADDNFGMYALDEEIADYIAYLQDEFGWPHYIRTTTGKNRGERIIKVMRKIRGALPMTAAVQSLNPVVLANIKRANISLNTYAEIQKEVQSQGMQAYGELIIALPGETKATFMESVRQLLETGVKRISAHQLMLLHGAPLSNPESRQKYGFKTRFRVVARNIGDYTGEPVIETEEMVVETETFSFENYLETRVFHLLLTIFYYEGNFEEAFEFARHEGIQPFDLIVRLQDMLDQAPNGFKTVIEDFLKESQEELFSSREECVAWAQENFSGLVDGSLGGNLLSKYSMLGRFFAMEEALDFLEAGIVAALGELLTDTKREMLQTVIGYLRSVLLHTPFSETVSVARYWTTTYDLEAWRSEGYVKHLSHYSYPEPQSYAAIVEAERKALLQSRVATFGEHPAGLGKFTRTMFANDLRRTLIHASAYFEAHQGV